MRPCRRSDGARAAAACLALAVLASPVAGQDERDEGGDPGPPAPVSGFLTTRYRGRFTTEEGDHDLFQTIDLSLTDPGGRWTGALLARGAFDLDGLEDPDSDFFGFSDTYSHRFQAQLLHAYLDLESDAFALLRFGRQPLYETPLTVFFDGLRAELAPVGGRRASAGIYAGVGEHPYESSSDGDLVLGTFGALRAWKGAELRADWMRLEDLRLGVDHEDDLFGLSLGQDVEGDDAFARLDARFTSLEGDGRDLRVTASHVDASARTSVQASVYRLLRTQKSLAAPLDPFSDTLFELFPYTQLGLSASKDWDPLALLAGSDVRRVTDASDEGEFNRDFERYFLTATLLALPVTVSLTGELWRATDTDLETWGAALERELYDGWSVEVGSYYALYEYDLFSAEERDQVRNSYIDLRWKKGPAGRWTLRYEHEDGDGDDVNEVRVDWSWGF